MTPKRILPLCVALTLLNAGGANAQIRDSPVPNPTPGAELRFIENLGQWPESVRFLAQGPSMTIRADCEGLGLDLRSREGDRAVRLTFEGSQAGVIEGKEAFEGSYSYFIGNDSSLWRSGARAWRRVVYRNLYPGVDLELHGNERGPEYDLVLAPFVDPSCIRLRVEGLDALGSAQPGGVEGIVATGHLLQLNGRSWQVLPDGSTADVECSLRTDGDGTIGVDVQGRVASNALVIDPGLLWSTYLGGVADDQCVDVEFDRDGDLYVLSGTTSPNFPSTGGLAPPSQLSSSLYVVGVTKFHGATGALIYSAVFGGASNRQGADGLAVDSTGRAIVVGWTWATDFPTTPDAYDTVRSLPNYQYGGFVTKLDATGTRLQFSTLLEGSLGGNLIQSVTLGPGETIIVGGGASASDFPVTAGAFQTLRHGVGDATLSCLSPDGSSLLWSTFVGGNETETVSAVASDGAGLIYAALSTGSIDFPVTRGAYQLTKHPFTRSIGAVCCFSTLGDHLLWASYLGGTTSEEEDVLHTLGVDVNGGVTVCGSTNASTFPTTSGAFQTQYSPGGFSSGFVTRFAPGGHSLAYSTFVHGDESGAKWASVDPSGVVTAYGGAYAPFPSTPGAYDTTVDSNSNDFCVIKLSPGGDRLFYATIVGGSSTENGGQIAVGANDRVAICGYTYPNGTYPVTPGAYQTYWGGGQFEGLVTVLDLFLEGVSLSGRSTPGCLGALHANATKMPVAGDPTFTLYCSVAPPLADGWLLLGSQAIHPLSVQGAQISVDLHRPFRRMRVHADAWGYCEVPLQLPGTSTGARFVVQFAFSGSPTCPSTPGWCASNALEITVQ